MVFGIVSKRRSLRFRIVKEEVHDERSEANMLMLRKEDKRACVQREDERGGIGDAQSKIQMFEEGEVRQQHEEKKRTEIRIITRKKSEHEVLARITNFGKCKWKQERNGI